jgi:hypothetical protein
VVTATVVGAAAAGVIGAGGVTWFLLQAVSASSISAIKQLPAGR